MKPRRQQLMYLIESHKAEHGVPPTQTWLAQQLGLSVPTVNEHLVGMEREGLITWQRHSCHTLLTQGEKFVYTPKQLAVMQFIAKTPAVTLAAVAKAFNVSSPTMFEMLSKLRKRGVLDYSRKEGFKILDEQFKVVASQTEAELVTA